MKKPLFVLPAAAAAAALWLPALSLAQSVTSGLPGYISYQGRVLNSSGAPVGAGTPVNRTVVFRIWDHPSNTQAENLIYSETQTVTIADGEFSVLVGQGVATTNNQFSFAETSQGPPAIQIANAFNGSGRYLGVTVDDGTEAVDNEITPRQQIVSSAFSFRARYAEQLGTSVRTGLTAVDSGNIGIGTANPPARLTVSSDVSGVSSSSPQFLVTDGTDPTKRLRIGVDSSGTGTGFLQAWKEGAGAQNLLLNPNGGFVGIGRTNPATALDVNGVIRTSGAVGLPVVGENGGPGQRLVLFPGSGTSIPFGFGIDHSTLWQAVPTNNLQKWFEGSTERMRLSRGNLGIGSAEPTARLTIGEAGGTQAGPNSGSLILDHENNGGVSSIVFRSRVNRGSDFGYLQYQDGASIGGTGEAAVLTLGISNDGDDHIALMPSGNVGVGTSSPTSAKLHVAGGTHQNLYGGYMSGQSFYIPGNVFGGGGYTGSVVGQVNSTVSIYGTGTIWAGNAVVASSDERIKVIKGQSDSAADLKTLMDIRITDYQYKDQVAKGSNPQKKVIAQQVEKVFPQAIGRQTEVIPDIFKPATVSNGWIRLETDLKAGDRVRLMSGDHDGVHEVLEVRKEMFRTAWEPAVLTVAGAAPGAAMKLFVYGREVKDFRTVDYEALAMLNVSATQQLKKDADLKLKAVMEENSLLRSRLAELEKRDAERAARLDEIGRLLETSGKSGAARPASGN